MYPLFPITSKRIKPKVVSAADFVHVNRGEIHKLDYFLQKEMNYPVLIYLLSVKEPKPADFLKIGRILTVDSKNNINYVFPEMMTDTMSQLSL